MPLLTLTIKEEDLQKKTVILLERPYNFTMLKLLHIYHNFDSINLHHSADKSQQVSLFIRLGGLVENSRQIINYVGDYDSYRAVYVPKHYDDNGYQLGASTTLQSTTAAGIASQVGWAGETIASNNVTKRVAEVDINHLIPIGASKHNSSEMISRDLFKDLHKSGLLYFNGELEFELFYMNHVGSIVPVTPKAGSGDTATGGGAVIGAKSAQHVSYMTLMFEYEE